MKICPNCKGAIREEDIYCRNCGLTIKSNGYYVFLNILIILAIIALIFVIMLFITSYIVD